MFIRIASIIFLLFCLHPLHAEVIYLSEEEKGNISDSSQSSMPNSLCSLTSIAASQEIDVDMSVNKEEECPVPSPRLFCGDIYLEHIEGGGIGYPQGYTTLGTFVLATPYRHIQPFIDLRGHLLNNGEPALNIGGGLRFSSCCSQTLGINFYYDYRQCRQSFHQLGLGFELLGDSCDLFDMRLNFYLPFGNKWLSCAPHTFTFPGDFFVIATKRQKVLKGADLELETSTRRLGLCLPIDLYAAFGAYYYRDSCAENIVGAKARLGIHCPRYIKLEFSISYDPTFKTRAQVLVGFNYYFGADDCDCCCVCQPLVRRQEIIVQGKRRCFFEKNF